MKKPKNCPNCNSPKTWLIRILPKRWIFPDTMSFARSATTAARPASARNEPSRRGTRRLFMATELKPCPFCGGKATMKLNDTTLNCVAVCAKCNVIMKRNFKGHKKLQDILAELMAEEWNRRAEDG